MGIDAFQDDEEEVAREVGPPEERLELLVFLQGETRLAVPAGVVEGVIPWQKPSELPMSSPHVHGVIQDRGRIITLRRWKSEATPARVLVCATRAGLIGLAATTTHSVGSVTIKGAVRTDTPLDTDVGILTLLDPEALADEMVNGS